MTNRKKNLLLIGVVFLALFVTGLWCSPSHAQSTGAPALSLKRVSIGIGGDWTTYRPYLFDGRKQEFRAVLPVAYNLGEAASITFRATRGFDSKQKEYSVGFVVHLLARGKRP